MKAHYRIDELADFLDVPKRTIYDWIACGVIRAWRVRRTIRISREEFERITGALPAQIAHYDESKH